MNKTELPFQVEQIISALTNKSVSVHLRGNYLPRVEAIRDAADKALKEYKLEVERDRINSTVSRWKNG